MTNKAKAIKRIEGNVNHIRHASFEDLMMFVIDKSEWAPYLQSTIDEIKVGFIYNNNDFHYAIMKYDNNIKDDYIMKMKMIDKVMWESRNEPKEVIREKYLKLYNDYFVICDILT